VPRYTERSIRKRSGGRRILQIPDSATRDLQRAILHRVLAGLKAHPAACAYERGKSICDNARPHVGKAVVVKLDLVNFFGATKTDRVERLFRILGWDAEATAVLTRLTTHAGGLPQGVSTSPRLSNLVNRLMDVQIQHLVNRSKGQYTRYADDITISFPKDYPHRVRGIVQQTDRLVGRFGYVIHVEKTRILRSHARQIITGLVVNKKLSLPRELRRKIRAAKHSQRLGRQAVSSNAQVAGWESLQHMVERGQPVSS
jgi:retron-type reverse transcriptase